MRRGKGNALLLQAFVVVSAGLAFAAFTVVVLVPNLVALYDEFISH
ncbi:MAG TPA: hypothetical protein VK821_16065 [Dehalococcoidia bacterium]|jgi:hypothetical protein|nr:hypothetical protein [Dehalococcoidia bacterium]